MTQTASIELDVNGTRHRLELDPSTPLLYVLRNDLGLLSPQFGCGNGALHPLQQEAREDGELQT